MAKRKSTRPPDKFRVGQRCLFVMDAASGWAPFHDEVCVVIAGKRSVNLWCRDWDGGHRNFQRGTTRYVVRWAGGELHVRESQLRPLYDGDEPSTWEELERATGLRRDGAVHT